MVVTFFPATAEMGVTQERVGCPSMCTVQAPHSAIPQPDLVPVSFRWSRMAHSRGMSGSTSRSCGWLLTFSLIAIRRLRIGTPPDRLDPGRFFSCTHHYSDAVRAYAIYRKR